MFAYTVTAKFEDAKVCDEYRAWLEGGHMQHVIEGGAREATLIQVTPTHLEMRYLFVDEAGFKAYEAGPAVPLRADANARFPVSRGIKMSRATGVVRAKLSA